MKAVPKSQIGHYKILSQIGAGGMGEVYLAEDTRLERKVTIKLLKEEYTKNADRMRRFVREAKTASSLNHPNIIVIHEIGEADGTKFIAAEYIEGETLRERFLHNPLTLEEILGVSVQIADALAAAHKTKIIHRDIKPENIMIRPDGYVKVLDFGLAKLAEQDEQTFGSDNPTEKLVKTNPGVVMGSAAYMSPEQARGLADVDERTDIFSLGIVLYEMLAGRVPFLGETLIEVITSVIYKDAPSVACYYENCPPELERIVMKSLEKDREKRYQGIKDLALDLKSFKRRLEFESELGRNRISEKDTLSGKTTVKNFITPPISTSSGGGAKDALLLIDFENTTGEAIFDRTLKTALTFSLGQSPFLDIAPDAKVAQTLRLMKRQPNKRVTRELAEDICLRLNLKAFLAGSVSNLGTVYFLTLEAVNARTGESLGREYEQANSKEEILAALGRAATGIREKLGESLSSIQKYDVPFEITTSSFEALKFFSFGHEQAVSGRYLEAIPFYQKALEFDPRFAAVYSGLAVIYANTNQWKLAAEMATKAFELRDSVGEADKLRISYFYYRFVTGEMDKAIGTLEMRRKTYYLTPAPFINLADCYISLGQFEKAVSICREGLSSAAFAISPLYANLTESLLSLGRYEEVKETCRQAFERNFDAVNFHVPLFMVGFIERDAAATAKNLKWFGGRRDEYLALDLQAGAAAFEGKWRTAQDFSRRAIELASRSEVREVAARFAADQALRIVFWSSAAGLSSGADNQLKTVLKTQTNKALNLERGKEAMSRAALALACAGQAAEAGALAAELRAERPQDTLLGELWLPLIRAALCLQSGKAKEALEELETAERFERAAEFYPQYLRGLTYLKLGKAKKAAAEFEKILNHRGESPLSAIYPLAGLGKARATKTKEDYEKFFEMWKEADEDMPALVAARKEFEELSKAK